MQNDTLINVARFCFGLNMFTTLPLELFVCREVIEQYFFDNEPFHMQRHVFFTTAILMSSMISMCRTSFPVALIAQRATNSSCAHHMRPRRYARDNRRSIGNRTRLHLPSGMLLETRASPSTVVLPREAASSNLRGVRYHRALHLALPRLRQGLDASRERDDLSLKCPHRRRLSLFFLPPSCCWLCYRTASSVTLSL